MGEYAARSEAPSSGSGWRRGGIGLAPVRHRNLWIAGGIFVQLIAVAIPVAWIVTRAKHDALGGEALRATLLVSARDSVHSPTGLTTLAGSAVLFALGSILVARPFVRSLGMLIVAVPLAAIAGVLVLGALALVVAVLIAIVSAGADVSWSGTGEGAHPDKKNARPKQPG